MKKNLLLLLIVFIIALSITSCSQTSETSTNELNSQENQDKYDILYSDYVNYHTTYLNDIEDLNKLLDEWNDVIDNSNLYTYEGYITKLTEIANQYVDTYEYYQVHQQDYIVFLEENKDDLEYSLEDFSVVEQKREIEDTDILFRQNIQGMADNVNSLIASLEQEEQPSEVDIQELENLAKLFALFV